MKIGILYPAPLEAALSSAAYHMLLGYLSREARVPVYTYFIDWDGHLRAGSPGAPSPRSLDAVLVSVFYELGLPRIVSALAESGLDPRGPRREGPIVITGGPLATANPIPVLGFSDAILPGEAEPVLDGIVASLERPSRQARLEALAEEGLLVPGVSDVPVDKVYVEDLDSSWYPTSIEIPRGVEPVWGRSYPLETSRGCSRGCRFCMEGYIFRPPRHRSYKRLKDLLEEGLASSGLGKVSFYSLSFFDNPSAEAILAYAVEELGLEVSVPSLRVDTLTRRRLELIARGGQRSIAIAPETGSCRIGRLLNKLISPERVVDIVAEAVGAGIRSVKLYIITPTHYETEEDFEATVNLIVEAAREARSRGGRLRVSANPLIPKPSTPLQWLGFVDIELARRRMKALKRLSSVGVRVDYYDPKMARVQAAVGRGGWGVDRLVVEWGLEGGGLGGLRRAARKLGVRLERLWGPLPQDEDPPWHDLVRLPGASPSVLRREYEAFLDSLASLTATGTCTPAGT